MIPLTGEMSAIRRLSRVIKHVVVGDARPRRLTSPRRARIALAHREIRF